MSLSQYTQGSKLLADTACLRRSWLGTDVDVMHEESDEEVEGEDEEAINRREARQRLKKEAEVCFPPFDTLIYFSSHTLGLNEAVF